MAQSFYIILALIVMFLPVGCSSESNESKHSDPPISSINDKSKPTLNENNNTTDSESANSLTNQNINSNNPSEIIKEKISKTEIKELNVKELKEAELIFEKLFTERIDGNDPESFNQTSEEFMKLGNKKIIPQLIIEIQSEQQIRREIASSFISRLAMDAKDAEEVLLKALKDDSLFVQINAASTLSVLNSHIEETVSTLSQLLLNSDSQIHTIAIISLRNIAEHADDAIPALIKLLPDAETDTQKEILITLLVLNKLNEEQLKNIQPLTESKDSTIKEAATKLINKHKPS